MENKRNNFYLMFLFFALLSNKLLAMRDDIEEYYKQGVMSFKPDISPPIKTDKASFLPEDSLSFDKIRNQYYYIEQINNSDERKLNGFWEESNNSSKYIYKTEK